LNAFAPALEQAIGIIKAQRAEINSLKDEELAEDSKQAQDEAALLGSLRAFSSTIATMTEKVAETVQQEPTASEIPAQPIASVESTTTPTATTDSIPRIDPLPTIQPTSAS
jgi:Tfp pilus assembly protein PilO